MSLFDLSKRLKLRMTGGDRVRFLNGQVTNDVRKANANLSLPACVLNAKGKIDAFIFINAGEEELFVDADDDQRETLVQRLERYVIADDVTIEDVTEKFALFHVTGETAPTVLTKRIGAAQSASAPSAGISLSTRRNTIAFSGCSQRRIRFVMRNAPSGGGLSMGFRAGATS